VRPEDIERFSLEARQRRQRDDARRKAWYREQPIGQQVQMAIEAAKAKGLDTTLAEASIRRRLKALQNKADKAA
jgi:hypothetical protein